MSRKHAERPDPLEQGGAGRGRRRPRRPSARNPEAAPAARRERATAPRTAARGGGPSPGKPGARAEQAVRPVPTEIRVKSLATVANLAATAAPGVLQAVLHLGRRLEPALSEALKPYRDVKRGDRRLIDRALAALLRWWGWIEPLRLVRVEDQLALAWLLDSPESEGLPRVWTSRTGQARERLLAVGDAPNWTARAAGLKRWTGGPVVNADPWRLFPDWLRDQLPLPPGDRPAKARRLDFLFALQSRWPLWVGLRGGDEKALWAELREAGLKPWIHRRLRSAARLEPDTDMIQLRPYREGELVVEDLAAQAMVCVSDPDPGERWWDVHGGAGWHALHVGALMQGKGTVITTFENEKRRGEAALRLRKFPFRNISARAWDGRRPPGKAGSFDGVLLDAPSSAVGQWRRHPELRWTVSRESLIDLARRQRELLELAAPAVRVGGVLVYSVATATVAETIEVANTFLAAHPEFRLDPFPHPLEDSSTTGILQLWPHLHDCEARFILRMVRSDRPALDGSSAR